MSGSYNYPARPGRIPRSFSPRDRRRTPQYGGAVAPLPIVATVGVNGVTTTAASLIGSVNPLGSSATWAPGSTPYNLVLNPSFEYDTTNTSPAAWTSSFVNTVSTTFQVQTGWAYSGTKSLRLTATSNGIPTSIAGVTNNTPGARIPVVVGQTYTLAAHLNVLSLGVNTALRMILSYYDSGDNVLASLFSDVVSSTGPTSLTLTHTAPPTATYATAQIVDGGFTGGTTDVYIDAVSFNIGSTASYVDGDLTGYGWAEVAGNSSTIHAEAWAWFIYGTTEQTTLSTSPVLIGSGTIPLTLTAEITGLTTGSTYYFACVGQTAAGTVIGPMESFVPAISQPIIVPPGPPGAAVSIGQALVTIPHFDAPFTLTNSGVNVVDQSTLEEIRANVLTIADCPVGACPELPGFGLPQPTFAQAPVPTTEIMQAIQRLEPRAQETAVVSAGTDGATWNVAIEASGVSSQFS